MSKRYYIRDDKGYAWYYDGEKIRMQEADGDDPEGNGYYCDSLEDGVKKLNEYGYISGEKNRRKGAG